MITLIILQIICAFAILYHIYKIKDDIDAQLKDLRFNQNLNNVDSDSNINKSDKYEAQYQYYPHKYNVNDLVIIDFKNGKKDDVKRLKDERLFNGAVCMIKYHIPHLKKSDSINYIVSKTPNQYYIVPENIIVKCITNNCSEYSKTW